MYLILKGDGKNSIISFVFLCYEMVILWQFLFNMFKYFSIHFISMKLNSFEMWSFELVGILSGLLPNPKVETSVLSIW